LLLLTNLVKLHDLPIMTGDCDVRFGVE